MAISGPPCTVMSAWRSPSRLSRRTATRPGTASLKIPVTTVRPFQITSLGCPTFTDITCITDAGCILFLLWCYDHDAFHNDQAVPAVERCNLHRIILNNIL